MVFFLFFFNAKCQVRKLVMGFMGWTEMPTTGSQTVPVVELNVLQQRLLPESKHAMFAKLVQVCVEGEERESVLKKTRSKAFSSAVQDIDSVLDEALFVVDSSDEVVKWKAREPELLKTLEAVEKLLKEHREVWLL